MSKKISIEKNIKRMEEIVDKLENEELDIEKALSLFEEGIGISQKCHQRLGELEKRVRLLAKDSEGNLVESDMKEA